MQTSNQLSRRINRRVTVLQCNLALLLLAGAAPIPVVLADVAEGCVTPRWWPNPMCFLSPSGSGCIKWVHNPEVSTCDGPSSYFRCFSYDVNGTVTVYLRPGTTAAQCADCGHPDWVLEGGEQGGPKEQTIHCAYNNDTMCYE